MQPLEVSGAVRPLQWSLGVNGLNKIVLRVWAEFSWLRRAPRKTLIEFICTKNHMNMKCLY